MVAMKPTQMEKTVLLVGCMKIIASSPNVYQTFEHEQGEKENGDNESFEEWLLRKAEILAKQTWAKSK